MAEINNLTYANELAENFITECQSKVVEIIDGMGKINKIVCPEDSDVYSETIVSDEEATLLEIATEAIEMTPSLNESAPECNIKPLESEDNPVPVHSPMSECGEGLIESTITSHLHLEPVSNRGTFEEESAVFSNQDIHSAFNPGDSTAVHVAKSNVGNTTIFEPTVPEDNVPLSNTITEGDDDLNMDITTTSNDAVPAVASETASFVNNDLQTISTNSAEESVTTSHQNCEEPLSDDTVMECELSVCPDIELTFNPGVSPESETSSPQDSEHPHNNTSVINSKTNGQQESEAATNSSAAEESETGSPEDRAYSLNTSLIISETNGQQESEMASNSGAAEESENVSPQDSDHSLNNTSVIDSETNGQRDTEEASNSDAAVESEAASLQSDNLSFNSSQSVIVSESTGQQDSEAAPNSGVSVLKPKTASSLNDEVANTSTVSRVESDSTSNQQSDLPPNCVVSVVDSEPAPKGSENALEQDTAEEDAIVSESNSEISISAPVPDCASNVSTPSHFANETTLHSDTDTVAAVCESDIILPEANAEINKHTPSPECTENFTVTTPREDLKPSGEIKEKIETTTAHSSDLLSEYQSDQPMSFKDIGSPECESSIISQDPKHGNNEIILDASPTEYSTESSSDTAETVQISDGPQTGSEANQLPSEAECEVHVLECDRGGQESKPDTNTPLICEVEVNQSQPALNISEQTIVNKENLKISDTYITDHEPGKSSPVTNAEGQTTCDDTPESVQQTVVQDTSEKGSLEESEREFQVNGEEAKTFQPTCLGDPGKVQLVDFALGHEESDDSEKAHSGSSGISHEETTEEFEDHQEQALWGGSQQENGSQDSQSTSPIPDSLSAGVKKPDINKNTHSKYNTVSYRKIRKGNTKQRIDEFESMMHA
ncbi:ERMIN protein, partial [Polypterus senegalus]